MKNISQYLDNVNNPELKKLLEFYIDSVPPKPYCSDLDYFQKILPKAKALEFPRVQHNFPFSVSIINLDIDHENYQELYFFKELPPPNLFVVSPITGKAHIQYHLLNKIYTNNIELIKAVKLLASVEHTLTLKWEADQNYTGLISKNPLYEGHSLLYARTEPYTLLELQELLPELKNKPVQTSDFSFGVGRNVSTFEYLRHLGYSYFTSDPYGYSQEKCHKYLFDLGLTYNSKNFPMPLQPPEINHVCKSISKWIARKYSFKEFSKIQKARNIKSITARRMTAQKLYFNIKNILDEKPELSNRALAKLLKVSEFTVRNAKKYFQKIQVDCPLFDISDQVW